MKMNIFKHSLSLFLYPHMLSDTWNASSVPSTIYYITNLHIWYTHIYKTVVVLHI